MPYEALLLEGLGLKNRHNPLSLSLPPSLIQTHSLPLSLSLLGEKLLDNLLRFHHWLQIFSKTTCDFITSLSLFLFPFLSHLPLSLVADFLQNNL